METEIIKSPNDNRTYKHLVLDNKLECILIIDKEAIKSAACLHIHVGAALEPKETPGLAHFLEHMLFLGTEKYPSDVEYTKFISDHGGAENAETTLIGTSYYFDIMNEYFEKALDMFAEFFKTPLFNPDSVDKEMKAVDSEFSSLVQSDNERILQIFENNSNPESTFNRFYAGNLKTLKKEGIVELLKQFHDKWYSSNVMKLCVYSNTEAIESTIVELFSKIVNQDIEIPSFVDPPAYSQEFLGNLLKVKSVLDENLMIITIVYPYYGKDYYDYSLQYQSHVIGHESENSLLSALISEDLATEVVTQFDHEIDAFSYFEIEITLTDKGFDNYTRVLEITWARLNLLKSSGPKEYVFDEYNEACKLYWRFYEKRNPVDFCLLLSERMWYYNQSNICDILTSYHLYKRFNKDKIQECLDWITPENSIINLVSQNHGIKLCEESSESGSSEEGSESEESEESDHGIEYQIEPWFGTKYTKEKYSKELVEIMRCPKNCENIKIGDPPLNVLFPKNLDILPALDEDPKIPQLILHNENMEIWHMKCTKFKSPSTILINRFYSNDGEMLETVEGKSLLQILILVIEEYFREFNYMADQASLYFLCSYYLDSIQFLFKGYSDRLEEFIYTCFRKLVEFNPENFESIFKIMKERWLKEKKNFLYDDPYEQLEILLLRTLNKDSYSTKHYISIGEKITFERFVTFSKKILKNGRHMWFCLGNLTGDPDTIRICTKAFEIFNTNPVPIHSLYTVKIVKLPENNEFHMILPCENDDEENSAIVSYYQYGLPTSNIIELRHQILFQILDEPSFNFFRTKEQLGYNVQCRTWTYRDILGGGFVIQSSIKSPEYLLMKIHEFINQIKEYCKVLTDEEFKKSVNAVLSYKKQPDINLNEVKSTMFNEISTHDYIFNRSEKEIKVLEMMLLEENVQEQKQALIQHFFDLFVNNVKQLNFEMVSK